MQRFHFQLDAVLRWRHSRLDIEEGKLRTLFGERTAIEQRTFELDQSEREQRVRMKSPDVSLAERAGFDAYLRWVRLERDRLRNLLADCDHRITEQRAAVLAARLDYELLEKLKTRRQGEWNAAFANETEQLAAEAYLAKFNRG